jgi:purine-binding chemotaxis protein CheW
VRGGAEGVVAAAEGEGARRLLLFAAGGRTYGSDIGVIREIVPFRRCTRLPGAPPYVCGLINLRGTLVTVVDLAARLAGDAAGNAASRTSGSVVLVEYGAKVVGLAVDQVRDVQAVAEEELEPVSLSATVDATASGGATIATTAAGAAAAARGGVAVYHGGGQLGGEVVVVLDVHTILRQVLA